MLKHTTTCSLFWYWFAALVLAWFPACREPPLPVDDAWGWDGGFEAPELTPPTEPTLPDLPMLTPCPEGWREVAPRTEESVATCDPWPASGRGECATDEAHFPGEPGCRRIGTACPAGDWAEGLPAEGVIYVRAGAGAEGDGSRGAPFGSIRQAVEAAEPGAVIAVGKGTFDREVRIDKSVTLWGACVEQSIVTSTRPTTTAGVIRIVAEGVIVRNLQLTGFRPGLVVSDAGSVHIEDLLIAEAVVAGVTAIGASRVTAEDVVVRGLRGAPDVEGGAFAIQFASHLSLNRAVLERNEVPGISIVDDGTTVELSDVVISHSTSISGSVFHVICGAQIEASRVVIEENDASHGIWVQNRMPDPEDPTHQRNICLGEETSLLLEDSLVRGNGGRGLEMTDGANLSMHRVLFERNAWAAMYLGMLTTDVISDVVARNNETVNTTAGTSVVGITGGASATLRRFLIEENEGKGITILDKWALGTHALLEHITIRNAECPVDDDPGGGIMVTGALVEARYVLIDDVPIFGVFAARTERPLPEIPIMRARLQVEDLTIRDIDSCGSPLGGYGIASVDLSQISARRVVVEEAEGTGILVMFPEQPTTFEDLVVRDTLCTGDGRNGQGLEVQLDAEVDVSRALFERNHNASVLAVGRDTAVRLSDVGIQGTLPMDCHTSSCGDSAAGNGLTVVGGAHAELERFQLAGNTLCGIMLAYGSLVNAAGQVHQYEEGGTAELTDGLVSGNHIGANIQTSGFDTGRLTSNVGYIDNERNLDTTELPVPGVTDDLLDIERE